MSKNADAYRRDIMPKLTQASDPELRQLVVELLTYTKQLENERQRLKAPVDNNYLGVYRGSDQIQELEKDIQRVLQNRSADDSEQSTIAPVVKELLEYTKSLYSPS